ncbi:ATP-binding cassette domain-containing protein [Actinospica durhamensis]|uniref:ATP-binding cassette domain-containing protein n=1 Tax=Actinospica durhamensis TaxID=1508375 RepID=A0A941EWI1_9ACTN|nr:ATP-binding cassette domain-containing protein [Actinospica durhamensis]MBR7839540.1 ATP-binding cassette domain-containing protein [Actinospica durhamensis]
MSPPISALSCDSVHVRYGGIEVLHGVGLALAYGTFSALVGPNGAGKTTLLDWCAGAGIESSGSSGSLLIEGRQASTWPVARRALAGLRYVPFERNVFPSLTVLDNLRATQAAGVAPADPLERTLHRFPELTRLLDRPAGVLSGGERQLLAVACALQGPGRILLLDEPTHALAPAAAARVIEALAEAAREGGRAVLVAEPSTSREALRAHADFIWPLDRGLRLAAQGG